MSCAAPWAAHVSSAAPASSAATHAFHVFGFRTILLPPPGLAAGLAPKDWRYASRCDSPPAAGESGGRPRFPRSLAGTRRCERRRILVRRNFSCEQGLSPLQDSVQEITPDQPHASQSGFALCSAP